MLCSILAVLSLVAGIQGSGSSFLGLILYLVIIGLLCTEQARSSF